MQESIIKRAKEKGCVTIEVHNIRDYAAGRHRVTDDRPYGGGPGMVMKPEPVFKAVESLRRRGSRVLLMSPSGKRFDQRQAEKLVRRKHLIFLCGHYEGFDQRVHDELADEELSIGDYVLTNGALAAMVVVDAVVRLLPGVLGDERSAQAESFTSGILDHPHYTRPEKFRGKRVPNVLLSGNHTLIEQWRAQEALRRTKKWRADLIDRKSKTVAE